MDLNRFKHGRPSLSDEGNGITIVKDVGTLSNNLYTKDKKSRLIFALGGRKHGRPSIITMDRYK